MIDIKKSLDILGIKETNHGTSTGVQSFGGKEISSFLLLIFNCKVTTTTSEEYEKVINLNRLRSGVSSLSKRGN